MSRDDSFRNTIVHRTRLWVRENFLYMRPDWPLEAETPLLRGGVIDSVGVIEMVAWLEATFHLTIPEAEITEEHLGTLAAIGEYLTSRLGMNGTIDAVSPRHIA